MDIASRRIASGMRVFKAGGDKECTRLREREQAVGKQGESDTKECGV
jgi:hypothetical protein